MLQHKDLNKIAALIKDSSAWNAYLALLSVMEETIIAKLTSPCEMEELIRINAEYRLIQKLKKQREIAIRTEKEHLSNAN